MVAMHRLDCDCTRIGAWLGFVKPTVFEARTA
jgi:hypothetical protein